MYFKKSPHKLFKVESALNTSKFTESLHLQFLLILQSLAFMTRYQFFPMCPPFVNTVYGLLNIILQEACSVTIILELNLARLISLLFLSVRNCFMRWLSFTRNEYFLIVCCIKHWKSQCGKMRTWICHYVNTQLSSLTWMYLQIDKLKSTAVFTATLHVTIFFLIIFEGKNIAQSDNPFAIFYNIIILDVLAKILNTSRIIY